MTKPKPPREIAFDEHGYAIAVTPTDEVEWDDDYDTWVVHYETTDARVMDEFRAWRAVWNNGRWTAAEI